MATVECPGLSTGRSLQRSKVFSGQAGDEISPNVPGLCLEQPSPVAGPLPFVVTATTVAVWDRCRGFISCCNSRHIPVLSPLCPLPPPTPPAVVFILLSPQRCALCGLALPSRRDTPASPSLCPREGVQCDHQNAGGENPPFPHIPLICLPLPSWFPYLQLLSLPIQTLSFAF